MIKISLISLNNFNRNTLLHYWKKSNNKTLRLRLIYLVHNVRSIWTYVVEEALPNEGILLNSYLLGHFSGPTEIEYMTTSWRSGAKPIASIVSNSGNNAVHLNNNGELTHHSHC